MKIFSGFVTAIFVVFALLQFNDPDPIIWAAVYLFSAYTAFCSTRNYYNPMLLMMLAFGYLVGAVYLFPFHNFQDWIHVEEQAKSLEMKMPFVEEARESLGLLICFSINLLYMFIGFRKAKQPNYNFGYFYKSATSDRNKNH